MKIKKSIGEWIFQVINVFVIVLLLVITLYPFWYVICASVSNANQLAVHTGLLLNPIGFNVKAYQEVLSSPKILRGFVNTFLVVIGGVGINMLMTCLGGYALSRKDLYWKNKIMLLITFTMFFNGGLIPTYFVVKNLHLDDTLWALIVPYALSTANLIIMRTAFLSVPDSLEEAAKLDGANDLVILFRIALPVCMPTISVLILYYAVAHWNSWFAAMIYLRNSQKFPLQLVLRDILLANTADDFMSDVSAGDNAFFRESIKYATIMVSALPIICVYPFLQKFFEKGVMIGAIKE